MIPVEAAKLELALATSVADNGMFDAVADSGVVDAIEPAYVSAMDSLSSIESYQGQHLRRPGGG